MSRERKGRAGAEFTAATKRAMAARAGHRCSRPGCGVPTDGAKSTPTGVRRIGEAAHIHGASKDSARWVETMSDDERRALDNGIWLCCNCHTTVDRDEHAFSAATLRGWRQRREAAARDEVGARPTHRAADPGLASVAELGGALRTASQRSWWKRLGRFMAAVEAHPDLGPASPGELMPGDPAFLWSYDDADLDPDHHAAQAVRTLRFFLQEDLPRQIGDFSPRTHAVFQVRTGTSWSVDEWPAHREGLYETFIEPIERRATPKQAPPPVRDPQLHLRLLEVDDELATAESRIRKVRITYARNLPGHRGTYRKGLPGLPDLVMEVGETKEVYAEIAAELVADHGAAFVVDDKNLPPVPDKRGAPYPTSAELIELRRKRERLLLALGLAI